MKARTTSPVRAPAGRPTPEAAGACVGELFADHGRMVYGLCRILPEEREDEPVDDEPEAEDEPEDDEGLEDAD